MTYKVYLYRRATGSKLSLLVQHYSLDEIHLLARLRFHDWKIINIKTITKPDIKDIKDIDPNDTSTNFQSDNQQDISSDIEPSN